MNLDALHDIHNELSPLFNRIEVLSELCEDHESGTDADVRRVGVLHTLLVSETKQFRELLDTLLYAYTRSH